MRIRIVCMLALLGALPVARAADWEVYQGGGKLELALDRGSVWREADGLIHFVNQERFADVQHSDAYRVDFGIRRTTGYANCTTFQYVFVSSDLYAANNRRVWSNMYPLPRYAWKWQPVEEGSVADALVTRVCQLARTAPSKKPE